ncbi:MAG: hypothetical protein Tsb0020_36790 [Haliangiales bacterium]
MWIARDTLWVASTLAVAMFACSPSPAPSGASQASPSARSEAPAANQQQTAPASAPAPAPVPADAPRVALAPEGHPEVEVVVELVRTRRDIQRGLMYRQHLPADHGMLFLMGEERVHSFWMRNTLIPLDMLFITRDMTVAGVVENAEPLTDTSRSVGVPSYYVLEVNGGWAAEHHVGAGTAVRFVNVEE